MKASPLAPVRAVHLDLKGLPPTFSRLLKLVEIAKAAGYNALLVEWEDQFPWKDRRFRSETAYSEKEVLAFHARAGKLGMEIIPLVQCLGHMETWLRLPENKKLREIPDEVDVINPLAPGARVFVESLVNEVLALTPGCRTFHLGGDEAWSFGRHPDTKAFVKKHGKGALYLRHVEPILDRLLSRSIRPLLWHDMMLEWDDRALSILGRKADLCVWAYDRYDREKRPWIKALDKEERASRLPILNGGGGHPVCDPLMKRFLKAGVRLWGSGAYKCGGMNFFHDDLPDPVERLENASDWGILAKRFPLRGLISTAWSRNSTNTAQYSPIDASLDLLVGNGLLWNGKTETPLHTDETWREKVLSAAQKKLESLGEKKRFEVCHRLMANVSRQRRAGWDNAVKTRENLAGMSTDPRRRAGEIPLRMLGYLKNHQIHSLEKLEREILAGYRDLVPKIWLERYLAERTEPLRQEYLDLGRRVKEISRS